MAKKFVVLYHAPISVQEQMAKATPEQTKAGMDAWMSWANKVQGSIVDLGAPLGNRQTLGQAAGKDNSTVVGYSCSKITRTSGCPASRVRY
jgi:hypothetical protein